jgi:hypothetical protein
MKRFVPDLFAWRKRARDSSIAGQDGEYVAVRQEVKPS